MSRNKQLILIVPPGRYRELLSALTMPVAVVRLANYVQRARPNIDCHVIEAPVVFGQPVNEAGEAKVHQMMYEYVDALIDGDVLIGFSTFANRDVVHALPIAKEMKRRYSCPILLGGYAASTCADLVAQEYPDVFDGICVSAGEEAILAALDRMDGPNLRNRDEIPNLVYAENGVIKTNERLPAPKLATLPLLDLSVLHRAECYEQLPYFSTAGCPFTCDFCYEPWMYPGYDKSNLDHILKDLDAALSVLDTPLISFVDPLFGGDKKQTLPLLDAIRGSDIRFTFYTRVDVLDEQVFAGLGDNCNLMFVGLEAVSESSLTYMNKTHNADMYIKKMGETMRLAFQYGVTPQIGIIPNYPLNRKQDVDSIFKYLDHLRAMHDEMDPNGPGFYTTPFGYHIWPGLPHFKDIEMLEAMGMSSAPGFAPRYHGLPVSPLFRRDVTAASKDYSHEAFLTDRFRFYGKAHKTPQALKNIDNYNLGFMNAAQNRIVRLDDKPLIWLDDEQNVLDTAAMYKERLKGRPGRLQTSDKSSVKHVNPLTD
jgi:radical SAM superfamily enzyme YgiQ (UPF0313 family)